MLHQALPNHTQALSQKLAEYTVSIWHLWLFSTCLAQFTMLGWCLHALVWCEISTFRWAATSIGSVFALTSISNSEKYDGENRKGFDQYGNENLREFKSNHHSLHKWHRVNICALDSWHWSFQASATTNWLVIVTTHSIDRSLVFSIVHHSSSFSWAFPSSLSLAEVRLWSKLLSSPWSQYNLTI